MQQKQRVERERQAESDVDRLLELTTPNWLEATWPDSRSAITWPRQLSDSTPTDKTKNSAEREKPERENTPRDSQAIFLGVRRLSMLLCAWTSQRNLMPKWNFFFSSPQKFSVACLQDERMCKAHASCGGPCVCSSFSQREEFQTCDEFAPNGFVNSACRFYHFRDFSARV
jgi:hypothetical protein